MVARQTSIKAYLELEREGALAPAQQRVLTTIRNNPDSTDAEVAEALNAGFTNQVRPRRFELAVRGLVVESGKRACRVTGRTALTWRAT
jgi:hypothetical protein